MSKTGKFQLTPLVKSIKINKAVNCADFMVSKSELINLD